MTFLRNLWHGAPMKNLSIVTMCFAFATSAWADAFMGELSKGTCTKLKGQTFGSYSKAVLGDKKYEVTLDDAGACGKSVYVLKKEGRKRWAVFPDEKGCLCYVNLSKVIEKAK